MAEFSGETVGVADVPRLVGQAQRVFSVICDGKWRTLWQIQSEIKTRTGFHDSETGISARLRGLRNEKKGGYTIESKVDEKRHWWYRMEMK